MAEVDVVQIPWTFLWIIGDLKENNVRGTKRIKTQIPLKSFLKNQFHAFIHSFSWLISDNVIIYFFFFSPNSFDSAIRTSILVFLSIKMNQKNENPLSYALALTRDTS